MRLPSGDGTAPRGLARRPAALLSAASDKLLRYPEPPERKDVRENGSTELGGGRKAKIRDSRKPYSS